MFLYFQLHSPFWTLARVCVSIKVFNFQYSISIFKKFQVAIEVEREEDEGGMAGETFTDYVNLLICLKDMSSI